MEIVKSRVDEKTTYKVSDKQITVLRDGESATLNFSGLENTARIFRSEIRDELLAIRFEKKAVPCKICEKKFIPNKGRVYCSTECQYTARAEYNRKRHEQTKSTFKNSEKPNKRKSNVADINRAARELGLSYGQYQAMKYREMMQW